MTKLSFLYNIVNKFFIFIWGLNIIDIIPNFDLIGLPKISQFPAVKWKLKNISKMTLERKNDSLKKLKKVLKK